MRRALFSLCIAIAIALAFGGSTFPNSCGKRCTPKEHRHKEKRYVSIFTKESDVLRWKLPAIVSVRRIQDELCATKEHRHIDTVYWPDGGRTAFKDCTLYGNFIGDCGDEQGRSWRAKVFAKTTDEIPKEYNYPESSIPDIRALLGE